MPYRHLLRPEYSLGVIRFTGLVDGADLLHAMRALYLDPVWEPSFSAVWDFREVGQLILFPSDITDLLALFEELKPRLDSVGRTAVLARRQIDRIMSRLILRQRERHIVRATKLFFTNRPYRSGVTEWVDEHAAAWLSVPVGALMSEPETETDANEFIA